VLSAGSLREATELARGRRVDAVVSELSLGDGTALDLVSALGRERDPAPPLIIHTGKMPTTAEQDELERRSAPVILKGPRSAERLADEVTGYLRRDVVVPGAPRGPREDDLADKTVLVVEDDVRNVFALTKLLEGRGARIVIARNGREALERLEEHDDVALVLMDVMMPEMDGLEATRQIRTQAKWADLPVIALTAKAMPDDRKACLEAGANDYVPKPIDVERLLSLCRIWIQR
jgi:CheY-like chemotaxis protein